MTSFETTHRNLALLKGFVFCPMSWDDVTREDTILSPVDGKTRYVVNVEKHYETAMVTVMHGNVRECGEKNLDDPVHVLQGPTDWRLELYLDGRPMRERKRKAQ